MIEIEFRIGGRNVSFDKGWDEVEAKADAEVRKGVKKYLLMYLQSKLSQVRCPDHGGAPRRVIVEGPSWEKLGYTIPDPCCQKLSDELTKALK